MMEKSTQRGMTLLETLIALVILAGAITTALAIVRTAERLNAAGLRRQQNVDNAFGESYLRALFEGMAPVVSHAVDGAPILDFAGDASGLEFYSTHFADAERPHLNKTHIRIVDGAVLLSRERDSDAAQNSRVLMILDASARLRYGEVIADGRLQFRDDWTGKSKLPDVIVIEDSGEDAVRPQLKVVAKPALSSQF